MATHCSVFAWRILMNRGAWQATVHRVTKSRTRLKRLSTYSEIERLHLQRISGTQDFEQLVRFWKHSELWCLWGEFRMKDTQGEGVICFMKLLNRAPLNCLRLYFQNWDNLLMRLSCATTGHSQKKYCYVSRVGLWLNPCYLWKDDCHHLQDLDEWRHWPWRTDLHHLVSGQSIRPLLQIPPN